MDGRSASRGTHRPAGGFRHPAGVVALFLAAGVTAADVGPREARRLRDAGAILPLEEILAVVADRQAGRVLETELEREDGRYVYEIELLDAGGRVHEFEVDAATARVLDARIERDDD